MKVGRLFILSGPHNGVKMFALDRLNVFEVGKASGSHIKIRDDNLAMNHCRIYKNGEEYTLYALSENKPTIINGEKIKKSQLHHEDRIFIGDTEIIFELLRPEELQKPTTAKPSSSLKQANKPVNPATSADPSLLSKSQGDNLPLKAQLVVKDGESSGQIFKLTGKKQFKIGRATNNDIRISDSKISRAHCIIEENDNHFIIIDLESANGTIINGEKVHKTILNNGDFLRLGFTILQFELS